MPRTRSAIIAGLIFTAFGCAFAVGALPYPLGSTERMGPGFFPLLLGGVLAVLGVALLLRPSEPEDPPFERPSWRGLVLLSGALLLFGLTIRGLGLIPSVFLTALLASLGSREIRPLEAVGLAVALTALSVVIFVVALQLPLPVLGTWLPRP